MAKNIYINFQPNYNTICMNEYVKFVQCFYRASFRVYVRFDIYRNGDNNVY